MPRVRREERAERNVLVLRLFLSGWSYSAIGRHEQVRLSPQGVANVVHAQLRADAVRSEELIEQARTVWMMRAESLLRTHMPRALRGDVAAAELCRKVLSDQARFFGLYERASDG